MILTELEAPPVFVAVTTTVPVASSLSGVNVTLLPVVALNTATPVAGSRLHVISSLETLAGTKLAVNVNDSSL